MNCNVICNITAPERNGEENFQEKTKLHEQQLWNSWKIKCRLGKPDKLLYMQLLNNDVKMPRHIYCTNSKY